MKSPAGVWYCHEVDQFQSDETIAGGEHPDNGTSPPSPAGETEFRETTLDLTEGGRYVIAGPELEVSSGTWEFHEGTLSLNEDPNAPSRFEKLRSVSMTSEAVRLEFKLIPDAHDGLDVMALVFRFDQATKPKARAKSKTKQLTVDSVIEAVKDGKWTSRQRAKLDALPQAERLAIYRAAWDGFVAGTFAGDRSATSFRDQTDFLVVGAQLEKPAPTHEHLAYAIRTLDEEGRFLLAQAVATALFALPASPDDAKIAEAMTPQWLEVMAPKRFQGRVPDAWNGAFVPQPAFDEACRSYLTKPMTLFSPCFDHALRLFDGRLELTSVLLKHHGQGALGRIQATISARGLAAQARASVAAVLAELEPLGGAIVNNPEANTRRQAALAVAVLFRESETSIPADVVTSLAHIGGYSKWMMNDEDKALLRSSSESLPAAERALVISAFYL